MKKLLLKINLLSSSLATPTLILLDNYNQSFSTNYMEQQTTNFPWTNGSYEFSYKQKNLYVRKEGTSNDLKITDFEGTVIESYFSDKNNDVLFTTDKGLILIKEDSAKALKVNGVIGTIASISSKKTNKDVLILTKEGGLFILKEGSIETLYINGMNGTIQDVIFIVKNDVIISTDKDLFVLWEDTTNALKINGVDGKFDKIVISSPDDKIFICTDKGSFILNSPSNAIKTDKLIVDPVSSCFRNSSQFFVVGDNYVKKVESSYFDKEFNYTFIYVDNNLYIVKKDSKKALKINGISGNIRRIVLSENNSFFIVATEFLFLVKEGSTMARKQN